jgi:hypothetical protein
VKDSSGEMSLEKNIAPVGSLGSSLCSSPFGWLHPRYVAGLGFSLTARVQLQHPVFIFSGHSLCRWPPPHHKHPGGLLAVDPDMAKVLATVALRKARLSAVYLYHDENMVKGIDILYFLLR